MPDTFIWIPSWEPTQTHTPRTLNVVFGDNYEQRSPDGINTDDHKWDLVFDSLTEARAAQIDSFLKKQGAVSSFFWTPNVLNGRKKLYVCRTWQNTPAAWNNFKITATFEKDNSTSVGTCTSPTIAIAGSTVTITTTQAGGSTYYSWANTTDPTSFVDPSDANVGTSFLYSAPFPVASGSGYYKVVTVAPTLYDSAVVLKTFP